MSKPTILFNDRNELRSGWRIGIFILLFVFILIPTQLIALSILQSIYAGTETPITGSLLANGIATLFAAILAGWICGKWLEGLSFKFFGAAFTDNWLLNLGSGLLIGSLTFSFAVLIPFVFGGISFNLSSEAIPTILANAAVVFGIFFVAGAYEEALFRGYIFQTLTRSGLAWFAIALTSVFFGIVHMNNPNWTYISTFNTMLAGVWFGIAYLKTRDLWFVTGLHVMWNFTQGSIYGIEVSGLKDIVSAPLLNEVEHGPAWLSGGDYGIEASIAATVAIIISTAAIHFLPIAKPDKDLLNS